MAFTGLDSSLNGDQISNSPAWSTILQHSPLHLRVIPPDQPGVITIKSDQLWGLVFSSSQNAAKFGPIPPPATDAATPDLRPDAVFGLLATAEANSAFQLEFVRSGFGLISSEILPQTTAFCSRIDPNRSLSMSLDTAPEARCGLWALSCPVYRTAVLSGVPATPLSFRQYQNFHSRRARAEPATCGSETAHDDQSANFLPYQLGQS